MTQYLRDIYSILSQNNVKLLESVLVYVNNSPFYYHFSHHIISFLFIFIFDVVAFLIGVNPKIENHKNKKYIKLFAIAYKRSFVGTIYLVRENIYQQYMKIDNI